MWGGEAWFRGDDFSKKQVYVVGYARVGIGRGGRAKGEDGEVAVVAAFAAEREVDVG